MVGGRGYFWLGPLGATVCGVATAYTAFQPALVEQQQQKLGTFAEQHGDDRKDQDTAISQAIISDLKEAEKITGVDKYGGFAWGIRSALFGRPSPREPQESTTQPGKDDGKSSAR